MPNDKLCVGCQYRQSNGWCMLTACANQKRYDISNYVVRITNTPLAPDIDVGHKKETGAINTPAS